jgi:hypothetical protein
MLADFLDILRSDAVKRQIKLNYFGHKRISEMNNDENE